METAMRQQAVCEARGGLTLRSGSFFFGF